MKEIPNTKSIETEPYCNKYVNVVLAISER